MEGNKISNLRLYFNFLSLILFIKYNSGIIPNITEVYNLNNSVFKLTEDRKTLNKTINKRLLGMIILLNILSKIKDREQAKKVGNYKLADQIRDELSKEGIDIKDEKGKTTWIYK